MLFLITNASFAQDGYSVLYNQVYENEWKIKEHLFDFDDDLKHIRLTVIKSGLKRNFKRVSDFINDKTEGGYVYYQAFFIDESTEELLSIQIFRENYGIRLIYSKSGRDIEYANMISEKGLKK